MTPIYPLSTVQRCVVTVVCVGGGRGVCGCEWEKLFLAWVEAYKERSDSNISIVYSAEVGI